MRCQSSRTSMLEPDFSHCKSVCCAACCSYPVCDACQRVSESQLQNSDKDRACTPAEGGAILSAQGRGSFTMYQLANCSCCQQQYTVDALQIARGISRWACPFCDAVTEFAQRQVQSPNTSQQDKQFWSTLGAGALFFGLIVAIDRIAAA